MYTQFPVRQKNIFMLVFQIMYPEDCPNIITAIIKQQNLTSHSSCYLSKTLIQDC